VDARLPWRRAFAPGSGMDRLSVSHARRHPPARGRPDFTSRHRLRATAERPQRLLNWDEQAQEVVTPQQPSRRMMLGHGLMHPGSSEGQFNSLSRGTTGSGRVSCSMSPDGASRERGRGCLRSRARTSSGGGLSGPSSVRRARGPAGSVGRGLRRAGAHLYLKREALSHSHRVSCDFFVVDFVPNRTWLWWA